MTNKPNLVTRRVGSMLVSCQNKETPSDRDWDGFLAALTANRSNFPTLKILVVTEGGGPTAVQRKRLEVALGGQTVRVAVVTDSIKVRFIVSSVALLNRHISTFSRSEFDKACEYLHLTPDERRLASKAVEEMEPTLEGIPASTRR